MQIFEHYSTKFTGCLRNNISETLKLISFYVFENIKVSSRLLTTLPITSCECERTFSDMHKLETYSRSTIVTDRLNGIAMKHVHQEINQDVNKVLDLFANTNKRLNFI